ncbi:U3 small nucleolar RNA-associated protein [Saitozyma podzolica]|uniref:U3 small nucleolar RNA-associated protein n=1 Tax=Saitozyma podzolica TaxID=1890683 RepID=A0A427Y7Q5_9TREE|nr:U3 small nucleolar RNA-associated protein [Saitozyma podzolica]
MPVPSHPPSLPLHRVRFFDHTPTPITALSFAPLPLPPAQDPTPSTTSAKGKERLPAQSQDDGKPEMGLLVLAREGGEVEVWEYVGPENKGMGNWVMQKTLPPTLTHPTISLMALVLRDPDNFHLKPYAVPRLADLRLFTAGSDSEDLTERCLQTGRILGTAMSCCRGNIFAESPIHRLPAYLASQSAHPIPSPPLWSLTVSPTHRLLCLATTSPTLHFLSIPPSPGSSLAPLEPPPPHLLRSDTLPSRTRTVSVAWGVPRVAHTDGEWTWTDTYLVTGNSDSSFRKWEISPPDPTRPGAGRVGLRGRAVVEKLGKRANKKATQAKGTIVWGVGVLPDHTIVTSDSLGSVTFWDGATLAQKQHFSAHKADGMCLLIGPSGRVIYTSGPDQRVCQFTLVPPSSSATSSTPTPQWALTTTKRMHFHDVRALAVFPPYVPAPLSTPSAPLNPGYAPVLASGGWDMSLVLTPAATPDLSADKLRNPLGKTKGLSRVVFEESYARKMSFLGGSRNTGRIAVARGARLVVGRKDRSVGIWRVLEDEQGWEKVLEMDLRLRTNIVSVAISDDGYWLAVSDLYETKLFRLSVSPSGTLHPTRIRSLHDTLHSSPLLAHLSLASNGFGATSMLFTPDAARLVLSHAFSAQIIVLELFPDGVEVSKCFPREETTVGGRVIKSVPAERTRKPTGARGTSGQAERRAHVLGKEVDVGGGRKVVIPPMPGSAKKTRRLPKEEAIERAKAKEEWEKSFIDKARAEAETEDAKAAEVAEAARRQLVANGDGDEEDKEESESDEEDEDDEMDGDDDNDNEKKAGVRADAAWVSSLAASEDGQWLAVADLEGRVTIFNLDTLQPHASLPTFPHAPCALLFPPAQPSLLGVLLPSNALSFYHIEDRRLLPPTTQLVLLNQTLRDQHLPVQSASFEPSRSRPRNAKLIVWSHDWIATVRLDLDAIARFRNRNITDHNFSPSSPSDVSKSLRRKRAREAREQLEAVSALSAGASTPSLLDFSSELGSVTRTGTPASAGTGTGTPASAGTGTGSTTTWNKMMASPSSADDPDFVKVTPNKFRSVAAVEWLQQGEMMVVERPLGDFEGELPPAFWTGRFGKS